MIQTVKGWSKRQKQLWRKPQQTEKVSRGILYGQRLIYLASTLCLLGLLGYLITAPSRLPRTHIFIYEDRIPDYAQLESVIAFPPLPYPQNSSHILAALRPNSEAVGKATGLTSTQKPTISAQNPPAFLNEIDSLHELNPLISQQIQTGRIRKHDVVLIYVRTQGISAGSEPLLLTHTGKPKAPVKRVNCSELIDNLSLLESQPTVLLLDYGNLETDLANGVLINDFSENLGAIVRSRGLPNFWAVTSHGLFEKSLISEQTQQTVFLQNIQRALIGEADANQNLWVELREFLSFLRTATQSQIEQDYNGLLSQTPQIFWGGNPEEQSLSDCRLIVSSLLPKKSNASAVRTQTKTQPQTSSFFPWPGNWHAMPDRIPLLATLLQKSPAENPAANSPPAPAQNGSAVSPADSTPNSTSAPAASGEAPASASSGKPTTTSSPATASSTAPTPKTPPASSESPSEIETTLDQCWQIYTQMLNAPAPDFSRSIGMPVSYYAPSAWRDLETLLIYAQAIIHYPGDADLQALNDLLTQQVLPLGQFQPTQEIPDSEGLTRAIDQAFPRRFLTWPTPASLELTHWIAEQNHVPIAAPLDQQLTSFQQSLEADTAQALQIWLQNNPTLVTKFHEPRLAEELLSLNTPWPICQTAIKTLQNSLRSRLSRTAEIHYVKELAESGDEFYEFGLLTLRAGQSPQALTLSEESFLKANRQYQAAQTFSREVEAVNRLIWQCVLDASSPSVQEQLFDCQRTSSLSAQQTQKHLDNLRRLIRLVQTPHDLTPNSLNQIIPLLFEDHAPLVGVEPRLQIQYWKDRRFIYQSRLHSFSESSGDPGISPITSPVSQTATQTRPPTPPLPLSQLLTLPRIALERWQESRQHILVLASRAQLANAILNKSIPEYTALQTNLQAVETEFQKLTQTPSPASQGWLQTKNLHNAIDQFAESYVAFGRAFIASAQNWELTSGDHDSAAQCRLGYDFRYPLFADQREFMTQTRRTEMSAQALKSDIFLVAESLRHRLLNSRETTPAQFRQSSREAAQIKPRVSEELLPLPPIDTFLPIEITGETQIDLTTESQQTLTWTVRSLRDQEQKIWVSLDFDPQDYEITATEEESGIFSAVTQTATSAITAFSQEWLDQKIPELAIHPLASVSAIGRGPFSSYLTYLQENRPPLVLKPNQTRSFSFILKKKTPTPASTQGALKLMTRDRVIRFPLSIDTGHNEPITLNLTSPTAEILAEPNQWKVRLLPNASSTVQFEVANQSSTPQTIDFIVLSLDQRPAQLPVGSVEFSLAQELQRGWSQPQQLLSLKGVEIPAQTQHFALPAASSAVPPAGSNSANFSASATTATASAPETPPEIPIGSTFMALIKNQTTRRVTLIPMEVEVLPPREYLQAQIDYEAGDKTLTLQFERLENLIPIAQQVSVLAEISIDHDPSTKTTFPIVLLGNRNQSRFQTQLTAAPHQFLSLELTIDGFPRAFRYEFPLNRTLRNIPEMSSSQIEILSPSDQAAFQEDQGLIMAEIRADLGDRTVDQNEVFLEFGIDENQDRDLRDESVIRLNTDRLAKLFQGPASKQTTLTLPIRNEISELKIAVPLNKISNQRVNLLGHIRDHQADVWSTPIEIIIDSQPPVISNVSLASASGILIGKPFPVIITANDGKLSGVQKVEALLDTTHAGEITPTSALLPAKQTENGDWQLEIPTAGVQPGGYLILTRATDRAGNISQTQRVQITLISPEQAQTMAEAADKSVRGIVIYGKAPVAAAQATLTDEQGETVGETISDNNGRFLIKNIKSGVYDLTVRAVERGKIRTLTQKITLDATHPEANEIMTLE